MRGRRGKFLVELVLVNIFIVMGCSNGEVKKKEIKIGVTLYNQEDVFISSITKEIEKKAKELEEEKGVKIVVDLLDGKEDMSEQDNQVDNLIKQNYDVICVNIVDRTAGANIIDKCKKENIPVIFFNREIVEDDMKRWGKVYYVGAQAKESGEMQGEILIEKYEKNRNRVDKNGDGKIQYAILEGEQGHQDATLRTEYCIKPLYKYGLDLEKVASEVGEWKKENAGIIMKEWLRNYEEKIEVIFSNNDEMALGAMVAIDKFNERNNRTYKPIIIGVDGTEEGLKEVEKGNLAGTIISDAKKQGESILEIAYNLAMGLEESIEENTLRIPHKKIISNN
ncbi:galactose ABC transporter substrate-binding protein [uncultured Clostridium sp.]|uniref:galactose ABC transporter substrate-binding protein n=1 Tax=uncultured Clostridium sp. TaxID=59620 RepID=UPI00262F4888|nr:galactose ABC transporter substrate-binding protein [uncultured Clostridium sp.]